MVWTTNPNRFPGHPQDVSASCRCFRLQSVDYRVGKQMIEVAARTKMNKSSCHLDCWCQSCCLLESTNSHFICVQHASKSCRKNEPFLGSMAQQELKASSTKPSQFYLGNLKNGPQTHKEKFFWAESKKIMYSTAGHPKIFAGQQFSSQGGISCDLISPGHLQMISLSNTPRTIDWWVICVSTCSLRQEKHWSPIMGPSPRVDPLTVLCSVPRCAARSWQALVLMLGTCVFFESRGSVFSSKMAVII